MNLTFSRLIGRCMLGFILPGLCLCASMFGGGCQQAAAVQSAATAVQTVKTAANAANAAVTAAPQVAQTVVTTAGNVIYAVPGAPQAVQAGQSAVQAVQTTAGNASETAGSIIVNNVPGAQEAFNAAGAAVQTAQNAGDTAAHATTQAIGAIPGGQAALNAVPKPILDILYQIITLNKLDLSKPQAIIVSDGRYIFVYPSHTIPILQQPRPNVIVIDTMTPVERLQRLEKHGY